MFWGGSDPNYYTGNLSYVNLENVILNGQWAFKLNGFTNIFVSLVFFYFAKLMCSFCLKEFQQEICQSKKKCMPLQTLGLP